VIQRRLCCVESLDFQERFDESVACAHIVSCVEQAPEMADVIDEWVAAFHEPPAGCCVEGFFFCFELGAPFLNDCACGFVG
jgi:hypothetical protein